MSIINNIDFFEMAKIFNLTKKDKIRIAKNFIEQILLDTALYESNTETTEKLSMVFDILENIKL